MANISHFTQTVNGVSTTYDIHDANAIPRSGGAVFSGSSLGRNVDNDNIDICGGTNWENGAFLALRGKNNSNIPGTAMLGAKDGTNSSSLILAPNGAFTFNNNGTTKNIAMHEDTVPRSGGAVMTGEQLGRDNNDSSITLCGGTSTLTGASIAIFGADYPNYNLGGGIRIGIQSYAHNMCMYADGTWTWDGTACQLTSDQRFKQQIDAIDDKLLDAWEDVNLVQFKYNDAVETKGDKARLHTGYVVQQIQKACEEHGVDISNYGLFCHEEYPELTEEVKVEQKDGTKTKERKVIREASEHYSLRYTEALIVECKYLRRCVERLVARIEELEKGNKEAEK